MNMQFKKIVAAAAVALVSLGAFAAEDTTTMQVNASIAQECSLGNAKALDFGALSMLSGGSASSVQSDSIGGGTFDAICTSGSSTPQLTFTSANSSGSDFRLVGADGSTYMVYTLAESANKTPIAYNTAAAFTGFDADGTTHNLAVIGSIAASEKLGKKQQQYSDTITIKTTFAP